jgi:hypothetical protein
MSTMRAVGGTYCYRSGPGPGCGLSQLCWQDPHVEGHGLGERVALVGGSSAH